MSINFIISMAGALICLLAGYKWGKSEKSQAEREAYLRGKEEGYKTAIAVRNDRIVDIVKLENNQPKTEPELRKTGIVNIYGKNI